MKTKTKENTMTNPVETLQAVGAHIRALGTRLADGTWDALTFDALTVLAKPLIEVAPCTYCAVAHLAGLTCTDHANAERHDDCTECGDDEYTAHPFECECGQVMHESCYFDSHECYATQGDAADARRMDEDH